MENRKKRGGQSGKAPLELLITVAVVGRKSGFVTIDFSFLCNWLGPKTRSLFVDAIVKHARRYIAAQSTYAVRSVLRFWYELGRKNEWPAPSATICTQTLVHQISELRGRFYAKRAKEGVALTTITNQWTAFLRFLPLLVNSRAIGLVESKTASFAPPSQSLVLADREVAANSVKGMMNAPKSLNNARNSFNDNLVEPISIIDSGETYLNEYQGKLGAALGTILRCAIADFESMEQARAKGVIEIARFDKHRIAEIKALAPKHTTWQMWAEYIKENPSDALHTALGVVAHDMGGIPKSRRKVNNADGSTVVADGSSACWDLVACYGKNALLPYLGVMTSKIAAVCLVILIIEHPILNPVSLYRAKVERARCGGSYISADGLIGKEGMRLSVQKLRAGMEKSAALSPLAQRVLARVFEWTESLREDLRSRGQSSEANYLWVGMSSLDYTTKAFSEKAFLSALGSSEAWRSLRKAANANRATNFAFRHPELEPWRGKLTYKNLRMSSGVLKFLEADGDLIEAARIFGHRSVDTTLGHYIPNALRLALFERQVRRHQNRLIVESVKDSDALLVVSDFSCIEDLHQFLSSIKVSETETSVASSSFRQAIPGAGLILYRDPHALAVAMLYRDRLEAASSCFLDRPDIRTGIAPRFWRDFVDRIVAPLPSALTELSALVIEAIKVKAAIARKIKLPEVA